MTHHILDGRDKDILFHQLGGESVPKLTEVENRIQYNSLKSYGLRHGPFRMEEIPLPLRF